MAFILHLLIVIPYLKKPQILEVAGFDFVLDRIFFMEDFKLPLTYVGQRAQKL